MTTERVDPVVRARGRTPGPEAVGGIAAVIVVAIVALGVMSPFASGSGDGASPTPAPSVTASPTARATPVIDPAVADLLIVVNQQLTRSGERLQQELDHDPFRTADASTLIRELNASARFGGEALPALGSVPEAAALAGRLGAVYDSLREIATRTLRASITNAPAYRQGAEQLVAQLADLPALQDELVRLKSGPSGPSESPAGSSPMPSAASPGPPSSAPPTSPPSSGPTRVPTAAPTPAPTVAPAGPSQVVNGGFEAGVGPPWSLRVAPGARATIQADDVTFAAGGAAARVEIAAQTPAFAGIVLAQPGIRLASGARYEIRVALRAETARDVRIQVSSQAGETYLTRVATATPTWSVASFVFTAPVSDADAVIELGLGRSAITTWVDEVYLGPPPVSIEP